jgi:hypothetical protein
VESVGGSEATGSDSGTKWIESSDAARARLPQDSLIHLRDIFEALAK